MPMKASVILLLLAGCAAPSLSKLDTAKPIAAAPIQSVSQTGHWITGTIRDSEGAPMPGVTLTCQGNYPVRVGRTVYDCIVVTDQRGQYKVFVPHEWSGVITPQQ